MSSSSKSKLLFLTAGFISGLYLDQNYNAPNINNKLSKIKKWIEENEKKK